MLDDLRDRGPFRHTVSFPRRRDGFHVMPTSAGLETATGPGYDWDGTRRGETPFSILQHTFAGGGRLRYEQRDFRVRPGETMLVTVPHAHRYWLEAHESWSFFWIAFSGREALRLHRAIILAAGPVFRLAPRTVDRLAEVCLALQSEVQSAGQASFEAYRATMALHDDLMAGTEAATGRVAHPDIERTVAYIGANLAGPLDIARLADVAGMSRAHFSRLFRRHVGQPPAEYVTHERVQRAAKLLADSRLSVKAISIACGFEDPNYFSKVFRRVLSISPAQFRTTGMYSSARGRER